MAIPRQRIRLPIAWLKNAIGCFLSGSLWDGKDIERFEQSFASAVGAADAVAVASGRAGLYAILDSLDLKRNAQIICCAFGYPIVPHLVDHLGYKVKFVDCELETFGMDPDALADAITPETEAIIVTHLYGMPCEIRQIVEIAKSRNIKVIEDCAHCFGASVEGKQVGTFGTVGYFSFETSKMINTMGGGMLTTNDRELANRLREVMHRQRPRDSKWLIKRIAKNAFEAAVTHPVLFSLGVYPFLRFIAAMKGSGDSFSSGYQADHFTLAGRTGKFTNYQARLGLQQLSNISERLTKRIENAQQLMTRLNNVVTFQKSANEESAPNYMLVTARISDKIQIGQKLLSRGIDTKCHYMRDCSRLIDTGETFENAAQAEAEILHLPAYPELTKRQVDCVARTVEQVLKAA